jgi:flavodoxin
MKALVVVESMWGNTRLVAEAVARGLDEKAEVIDVQQAPAELPEDTGLLVLGGPTHAFSMSRNTTRHDAVQQGAHGANEAQGIREWLEQLQPSDHVEVATFDTRVAKVKRLPGSAAKAAGKKVRRHHLGRLIATQSFYVKTTAGPLRDGELDRAHEWGTQLRSRASTTQQNAR